MNLATPPATDFEQTIRWKSKIVAAIYCRLIINTAKRFVYPFAPVLSRGLDVPLTAITTMIAVNQTTGILGLFFGPIGDRFGYGLMMLIGLGLLIMGMLASALLPFYVTIFIALFLANLGKAIFDPAIQAYVGERVSFRRRGFVVGLLEFSWAGSSLIGIPLMGWSIEHMGWQASFIVLGAMGGGGFVMLAIFFLNRKHAPNGRYVRKRAQKQWGTLFKNKPLLGILCFGFLVSAANDNLFVVFGAWMESQFGLTTLALGLGASIIGLAELLGEGMTVILADRMGLKRAITFGLMLSVISYGLLPFLETTLWLALLGIFMVFLSFEFTIVSALSLCTELHTDARGTAVAAFFAAAGCGRMTGALAGGFIWQYGNILMTGVISSVVSALGLFLFLLGMKRWQHG
jgi:predicted MFS family arabinose efflux permease